MRNESMQRPAGLPGRRLPATGPTQGTGNISTRLHPRLGGLRGLRCALPAAVGKIPLGTHTLGLHPVPAACRDPLYQRLLDEICMHSAATGQTIGFDGRVLQVGVLVVGCVWAAQGGTRRGKAQQVAGAPVWATELIEGVTELWCSCRCCPPTLTQHGWAWRSSRAPTTPAAVRWSLAASETHCRRRRMGTRYTCCLAHT